MLVTTDFFDDLMIRTFRFDHEAMQQRRDEALIGAARQLITMLENASQRADALALELQDYVERIEEKNKPEPSETARREQSSLKPKAKRKAKAKK